METLLQTQGVPEKSGMREILTFFREKGVKLALASSTGKKRILENLRSAGVQDDFDAVVSGQEVAKGKPKPDIFLLAAERIGCTPSDCYVFEDGINGVQAGIAAGCATVMIPDLIEPPKSLRPQCAAICGSLQEAMRLIEKGEL
jgi:HAD superfamily hydrolase (TIGR01509 family)